jgi:GABA(A) receptor-associated protein
MVMGFKDESTFDKRVQLSTRLREQYPDKIPVIVEAYKSNKDSLNLVNTRFLINECESVHKLIYEARKKIENLRPEEALFFFCKTSDGGDILAPSTSTMGQLYEKYKDADGMLYFVVTKEQVYGN